VFVKSMSACLALLALMTWPARGDTYHVNGACGNDAWSGLHADCDDPNGMDGPKATIQAAVDVAAPGDVVVVVDGVYTGDGNRDIDLGGKAITVRSANGPAYCVIDCQGSESNPHRAFHFHSGEQFDSAVRGFTIRGGYALAGGGILCDDSSPTLSKIILSGNVGEYGGGAIACYGSSPAILNCLIYGNSTDWYGAGVYCSGAGATIDNTTLASNSASLNGGAVYYDAGEDAATIGNSVVWGNNPDQMSGLVEVTYSDIEGGWTGAGNINQNPLFADASGGNYRLSANSPCIDAGDPNFVPPPGNETDLTYSPRVLDDGVDMGAYEYVPSGGRLICVDDDASGDPAPGDPAVSDPNEDGTHLHPYDAIQEAVNAAQSRDTIEVLQGTYTGPGNYNIDFGGRAIVVKSGDPNDPNITSATIVDCQGAGRGFVFQSGEDPNALLEGFTITNGLATGTFPADCGGGIYCSGASPTIRKNRISSNTAEHRGGGIYCTGASMPTLTGNQITANDADSGGGLACVGGSSTAAWHNTFSANVAAGCGGAVYCDQSSPSIVNNIFTQNQAYSGGALGLDDGSSPLLANNRITSNTATYRGGGIYCQVDSQPLVVSNTVAHNAAAAGGAMYTLLTSATVTNSILWANSPGQLVGTFAVSYSDVEAGWTGQGNINEDPLFADPNGDDYRLLAASPCIDAGDPNFVPSPGAETDLDGNARVINQRVDMGAYESASPVSVVLYVNAACGSDAWSGLKSTCGDPNDPNDRGGPKATIQAAIDAAAAGDVIVVADGVYSGQGNRDLNLAGKAITLRSENGPSACVIDCAGSQAEPHRGFVFDSGEGAGSVVRGFTIVNGYAGTGGGILCTDGSSPTLSKLILTGNAAQYGGGAIACLDASPTIVNCLMSLNTTEYYGGGMYCSNSAAVVANTTAADNTTDLGGGGISCDGTSVQVASSILWDNDPDAIRGSPAVTYTDVEGGWTGEGNIDGSPLFIDPNDQDYRLSENSPCIDAGDPNFVAYDDETDLGGNPRLDNERVDMGSYEYALNTGHVIYVDDDGPLDPAPGDPNSSDPAEDGSLAHPYDALQEGIDGATNGDTVRVLDGTYTGAGNRQIDFGGKAITVCSANGPEACTIDARQAARVFVFRTNEDPNAVLAGFTLANGLADGTWPANCGGGVLCQGASPTVRDNVFSGHTADYGGAIACLAGASPMLKDNRIAGSTATCGGAVYCDNSSPAITSNQITSNTADDGGTGGRGGGIACYNASSPAIWANQITSNTANYDGEEGRGGGIHCNGSSPSVVANSLAGNQAYSGGALCCYDNSSPLIANNLIVTNIAGYRGGGIYCELDSQPTLTGNTVVDNTASSGGALYCWLTSAVVKNSILWSNSPGQIVGTAVVTYSDVQDGWTGAGNIDQVPMFADAAGGDYRLLGGSPCVDAGDPNFVPPPDADTDLDGHPRATDGDGDATAVVDMGAYEWSYTLYVDDDADGDPAGGDPNASDPNEDGSFAHPFDAIQEAIDKAVTGYNMVVVLDGVYCGPGNRDVDFGGKAITVRSQNGPDNCIIDCESAGRGFAFTQGEGVNSVLDGLTIVAGSAYDGGAIYCASAGPTIENCILVGNAASHWGGAVYGCGGRISNCIIAGNRAQWGGGLRSCNGTITNCFVAGNATQYDGAGIGHSGGSILNSVIVGNEAGGWGGGLYNCDGALRNLTVAGNQASYGGGLRDCDGTISNCILWDNVAPQAAQIYNCSTPTYSCIMDWSGGGTGNIADDPLFVSIGSGTWTADGAYDPNTQRITFADVLAGWGEATLVGKLINPDVSQPRQLVIADNSATTITVWADRTTIEDPNGQTWVHNGDGYRLFDPHLQTGSPCVNGGDPNFVPAPDETDIDGDARVVFGRVEIGADEVPAVSGDLDADGDVDLDDYKVLAAAMGGPETATANPAADLDRDGDCDLADAADLFAAFTGPP